MAIPDQVLNLMKCCFSNDGHIAIEPIPVSCGATGYKQCLLDSNIEEIDCFSCKGKHKTQDLKKIPVSKPFENLVKYYVSGLFEYVKVNLDKTASSLEGKIEREILINNYLLIVQLLEDALVGELKSKLEIIESEMDMRVESLISSIHDYRDECKKKLDSIKDDFKKYL
jgi:hypothetical protein